MCRAKYLRSTKRALAQIPQLQRSQFSYFSSCTFSVMFNCRPNKFRHTYVAGLCDSFASNNISCGSGKYAQVEQKALVIDIPDIEGKSLAPVEGVSAVNLRPAGNPWFNLVPSHLLGGVAVQILRQERTRSHETHLTPNHIDQFRQFIQAGAAKKTADSSEALRVCEQLPLRVVRISHRTEFEKRERLSVQSWPILTEKHWLAQKQAN